MTPPKSQLAFQLKTLFMGSDGTIPENYARTVEKKQLAAWINEGLIAHRSSAKLYALTPKGENRIKQPRPRRLRAFLLQQVRCFPPSRE